MPDYLFHARDKNLQSYTFTAGVELDLETGAHLLLEDEATSLELDGSVSWQVHIMHAPPIQAIYVTKGDEIFSTTVEENFTLLNEASEEILNEAGDNILSERNDSWPTPLIHM
jgi:hypothetical protein